MNMREKLIRAAIDLIDREGLSGFGIRSAAAECGVSCAAPYKHFKNKDDLFLAVLDYVNRQWYAVQTGVAAATEGSIPDQLAAIGLAYIKFNTENPQFRAVVMLRDDDMTPEQKAKKAEMSAFSQQLISKWCLKAGCNQEQSERKTFAIRSFVFGAVRMLDSGELKYCPKTMEMVEKCIRREFELD